MNKKLLRYTLSLVVILISSGILVAQEASSTAATDPRFIEHLMENMVLITGAVVIVAALITLAFLVNAMMKIQQIRLMQEKGIQVDEKVTLVRPTEPFWQRLYKRSTNVVPVEREEEVLLDHNYDGIRELDNSLPPWWVAMFYITIVFGVVYFGYYHMTSYGMSSTEAYEMEMKEAETAIKAYVAGKADQVDETNVEKLDDPLALSTGQSIYETSCAVCHGKLGEGGVGPNLTDQYWIHGGDIKDIFGTIKYGVPEKGMIAWKTQLRPTDMQKLASYILTLQGSNPPNGKAPEGDIYAESK